MTGKERNWKLTMAAISCRLTPVHKRWKDGKNVLQCLLFLDGQKDPHSLVVEKKDGFVYAQLGEDAAIILDYQDDCEHLIIPGMIDGRKVLAVSGFSYKDELKAVTIEEGILQICYDFLHLCSNLECVELPASLVRIAGEFCAGDKKLREFKVSENSFSCRAEEGVLFDQAKQFLIRYPQAKPEKCYLLPESVKVICPNAFSGTVYLEKIIIPKGMERITHDAFSSCGLKKIELPNTLKEIESRAFFMSGFQEIQIPDSVEKIGNMAFAYSSELTEIRLPSVLKEFGDYVFQECHGLFKVQLSEGIQKLEGTFYECWDLEHVYIPSSVMEIDKDTFAQDNKEALGPSMEPLTIHGEKGSYIEAFAREKGISFSEGLWNEEIKSHWVQEETKLEILKNAKEGDKVTFGKILQQKHRRRKDPVLWRILKKENEKLLLLSEYCVKYSSFDDTSYEAWENSKLRKWLNEEFLTDCFTEKEKNAVLVTTVQNKRQNEEEYDPNQDSLDKIFCMSAEEVESLIPEKLERKACLTPYARACCGMEYPIRWWLRTEGERYSTVYVWPDGYVDTNGEDAQKRFGVRPALWLDLSKL